MKIINIALLAILLCGPAIESAHAGVHVGGFGRSGGASAFKGGFSSQKSALNRSAPAVGDKNTAFGSFGSADKAAPLSNSALSRDLNAGSANANALKTYDARNAPAASPAPGYTPNSTQYPAPSAEQSPTPTSYLQQTLIMQRHDGFSSSPFLWFMLGHAMSNEREHVVYVNGGGNVNNAGNGADTSPTPGNAAVMPEQKESLWASLLRIVLWLAIAGVAALGMLYYFSRRAARRATHYSL